MEANVEPSLELARRFVEKYRPPGRVVQCAVTGSHVYGFSSPDSDIDLKGLHLASTLRVMGLRAPGETHDRLLEFEGVECDYTSHEARKALSLLLKGNGNVLERLLSPIQLVESEEVAELQRLARGAISRRFMGHYAGFFKGVCKRYRKEGEPRAKSLLYAYRVALTGVHLLSTGELEMNVNQLAESCGFPEILELVALKREQGEKSTIPRDVAARHEAAFPRLEQTLEKAWEESRLQEKARNTDEVQDWLVKSRIADLRVEL